MEKKIYEIKYFGKSDAFQWDKCLIGEKFEVLEGRVGKSYPCAFTGHVRMLNMKHKQVTCFHQVYVKRIK